MGNNVIDINQKLRNKNHDPLRDLRIGLMDKGEIVNEVAFTMLLDKLVGDIGMCDIPFSISVDSQEYMVLKSHLYQIEDGSNTYLVCGYDPDKMDVDMALDNPFDRLIEDDNLESVIATSFDYVNHFYNGYLNYHIRNSSSIETMHGVIEKLQRFTDSFSKILFQISMSQTYRYRIIRSQTDQDEEPTIGLIIESDQQTVIHLTPELRTDKH